MSPGSPEKQMQNHLVPILDRVSKKMRARLRSQPMGWPAQSITQSEAEPKGRDHHLMLLAFFNSMNAKILDGIRVLMPCKCHLYLALMTYMTNAKNLI